MQEFNLGSLNDLEPINIKLNDSDNDESHRNKYSSFGTGIELLMNGKKIKLIFECRY